jgi:hypothetical protein
LEKYNSSYWVRKIFIDKKMDQTNADIVLTRKQKERKKRKTPNTNSCAYNNNNNNLKQEYQREIKYIP